MEEKGGMDERVSERTCMRALWHHSTSIMPICSSHLPDEHR